MNKSIILRFTLALILGVFLFNANYVLAEDKLSKIDIKTSAVCNHCKTKIEKGLLKQKGVKEAILNLDNKILTVTYDSDKITPEKLRASISKLGYDADDVKADPVAYKKLPNCCKGDGIQHKDDGCNHKNEYRQNKGDCQKKK
mgnify:CR=1 FL=1